MEDVQDVLGIVGKFVSSFSGVTLRGALGTAGELSQDSASAVIVYDAVLGTPFLGDEGDQVHSIDINLEDETVIRITDYDGEVYECTIHH